MKTAALCVLCALGAFFVMFLHQTGQFGTPDNGPAPKEEAKQKLPPAKFPADLAPASRGQPVPRATPFVKDAETHGTTVLTRKGTLHPWHERLHPDWHAESVESTELVLVVGNQTRTILQVVTYPNGAPPITRYRYDLDVWLVEAQTGRTIKSKQFSNTARPVLPRELWEITELGDEVQWTTVAAWMREEAGAYAQEPFISQ
jgi:hypothetical protein